jgi:hypothetical protein
MYVLASCCSHEPADHDSRDGTLLTNRFHMARIRGYDEELRGKGGVIGWYKWVSNRVRPVHC